MKWPITFKKIAFYILLAFLTAALHYALASPSDEKETEATVVVKDSKKGLYLFPLIPRYEVFVEGSDKPSKVSKKTYNAIEVGDDIHGYMIADRNFMTDYHLKRDRIYYTPILIGMYLFWLFIILDALGLTKKIRRRGKLSKAIERIGTGAQITGLITWFLAGAITICLIGTNVFHKLNTANLIETEATVLDKHKKRIGSSKGVYTTYELLLLYPDEAGEMHVTNKAVTGNTYWDYSGSDELTLFYRKNNVEDTFIQAKNFKEVWPTFVNLFTFMLGLYFVSIYLLIRHLRKK